MARWPLLLVFVGPLHAQQGTLQVESEPDGAHVLVGATPLGQTPVDASVAPGEYTITVALPGFMPVSRTMKLDPGVPKPWAVRLVPAPPPSLPAQPAWIRDGCLGVNGCGVGVSTHPSPAVAESSAWFRAVAGALLAERSQVALRTPAKGTDRAWARVRASGQFRVTQVRRHFEAGRAFVQVLPGVATYVTTVGAAEARGDPKTAAALARLAALGQALRWWFIVRDGVQLKVEDALYDPTPVGEVFSREITVEVGGSLGEAGRDVALVARTMDRQATRRESGGQVGTAETFSDVVDVQIRQHGVRHVLRVRDGIATVETGGDPARVLDDLERVLTTARIQTAFTPEPTFNGSAVQRAILR